jgi:hypothetical protein
MQYALIFSDLQRILALMGRLPAESRAESAPKKRPATDASFDQRAGVKRPADAAETV